MPISNRVYVRFLVAAVLSTYDTETVIQKMIAMGWDKDCPRLTPETIEHSIEHIRNVALNPEFNPAKT